MGTVCGAVWKARTCERCAGCRKQVFWLIPRLVCSYLTAVSTPCSRQLIMVSQCWQYHCRPINITTPLRSVGLSVCFTALCYTYSFHFDKNQSIIRHAGESCDRHEIAPRCLLFYQTYLKNINVGGTAARWL